MEHTDKMQMGFVGPLGQLSVFTLPFVPNWLLKLKPPLIYPARLQHPSKLFLKRQLQNVLFWSFTWCWRVSFSLGSPGCQGSGCSQQWDAHPMELIWSMFHEVVSNRLKHYCCHAAKPKQGWKWVLCQENAFLRALMAGLNCMWLFPQLAESSFLWDWDLF